MVYGRLVVDIISGADLPNLDLGFRAESDPYVIAKFGNKQVGRTKTLDNQPNPVWNESIHFNTFYKALPTTDNFFGLT